ncbi:MAG: lysoplasmalogenase [Chitinophagales bacterium]|nr:lysoplasmalogenase [Chitinophagales bacterium]MDW8419763.1 lysoplasmalogenase [Chitinophagales bacterium]
MASGWAVFYFMVGAIEVTGEVLRNEVLCVTTKPLLMITLFIYYITSIGKIDGKDKLMLTAIAFSWVGDVALMFASSPLSETSPSVIPKHPNFFLLGLSGFLITQILYCILFTKVSYRKPPILKSKPWVAAPLLIFTCLFLYILLPAIYRNEAIKPILIPVLIYALVISLMVLMAINRYGRVNHRSFLAVLTGAVMFMCSDSIIAYSRFISYFNASGVYIMVLYIIAQYLITSGIIAQKRDNPV